MESKRRWSEAARAVAMNLRPAQVLFQPTLLVHQRAELLRCRDEIFFREDAQEQTQVPRLSSAAPEFLTRTLQFVLSAGLLNDSRRYLYVVGLRRQLSPQFTVGKLPAKFSGPRGGIQG